MNCGGNCKCTDMSKAEMEKEQCCKVTGGECKCKAASAVLDTDPGPKEEMKKQCCGNC